MRAFWPNRLLILLGIWLISSPPTLGYGGALARHDVIAGLCLIVFGEAAFRLRRAWLAWFNTLFGVWITFAPLAFWTDSAAAYTNATLVGLLVAVCASVIPTQAGESAEDGLPPGWNDNPSQWHHRGPIVLLAFLGFLTARYLAAFQLGHVETVWEPFFGNGTVEILTSDVSHAFPVSDAGLGAWSYLLDALAGAIGGTTRWRRMPWMVILFGLFIVPPGATALVLVMLQPIAVGTWCTLCLTASAIMLFMVPPALDEVIASLQLLARARRRGRFWKTFWQGIGPEDGEAATLPRRSHAVPPLTLVGASLAGVAVMAGPSALEMTDHAADAAHVAGALIVTIAVIAFAQAGRVFRWLIFFPGLGLAAAIWFLKGADVTDRLIATGLGIAASALSIPLGRITRRFGSYDRWVRWFPGQKRSRGEPPRREAA